MPCRLGDLNALVALFNLLDGPNWKQNTNWSPDGTGVDPCLTRWKGVGCVDPCLKIFDGPDCREGRITSIDLHDNGLRGNLSSWTGVGELQNLTKLDLKHNRNITGSIPTQLGLIQNLEFLDLEKNDLTGGLLPEHFALLNANTSDGNIIKSAGAPAFTGELQELFIMRLEFNRLSGTIPTEIGLHRQLEFVHLGHNNNISGTLPTQLGQISSLQALYAMDNRISGSIPTELGTIELLRFVNMTSNRLAGTLPTEMGKFAKLRDLTLDHNLISGTLPLELTNVSSLLHLRMSDNRLQGNFTAFESIGNLASLETLDLYGNDMDESELPPSIQYNDRLKYLYVDQRHLRPLRQGYCHYRFLPQAHIGQKWNWVFVQEDYAKLTSEPCEDIFTTEFAFNPLQVSKMWPD